MSEPLLPLPLPLLPEPPLPFPRLRLLDAAATIGGTAVVGGAVVGGRTTVVGGGAAVVGGAVVGGVVVAGGRVVGGAVGGTVVGAMVVGVDWFVGRVVVLRPEVDGLSGIVVADVPGDAAVIEGTVGVSKPMSGVVSTSKPSGEVAVELRGRTLPPLDASGAPFSEGWSADVFLDVPFAVFRVSTAPATLVPIVVEGSESSDDTVTRLVLLPLVSSLSRALRRKNALSPRSTTTIAVVANDGPWSGSTS